MVHVDLRDYDDIDVSVTEDYVYFVGGEVAVDLNRDQALQAIMALDDGAPDLWHFESEFDKARAVLAKAKEAE